MGTSDDPKEAREHKEFLAKLTDEEKREHFESLSEDFIEENGEDANNMRLCVDLD